MKIRFSFALVLAFLITGACSLEEEPTGTNDTTVARINIVPGDQTVMSIGQRVRLGVRAFNATGVELNTSTITWSTTDVNVISISGTGTITGDSTGVATIIASVDGVMSSIILRVVDLSGTWAGGEGQDTVNYILNQTDTIVNGTFQSVLGFPPITDVNTGVLSGTLRFSTYFHTLRLTTEDDCMLEIAGEHEVQIQPDGSIILVPGIGALTSDNCPIVGSIEFAELRRQ